MGKKKTETTQTTKPIYSAQIEGAANNMNSVYNQQMPKIQGYADQIGGLLPQYLEQAKNGNPAVNAAQGYITDTLDSDPTNNPYLDDMVGMTNDNVRNTMQAQMGTRGQTGGSAYYDLIGRGLAQNELGMRYSDYDKAMNRKTQAAGMAPGIAAGQYLSLAPALQTADFASNAPMNAALKNAAGVGGLLGSYTNSKGTETRSGGFMGDLLLSMAASAGSFAGGGG